MKIPLINGKDHNGFGKKSKNASSKYFGVILFKSKGRKSHWRTTFRVLGKIIYLGDFKSEYEAAKKYDEYIVEHNLDNPLNFPENYEDKK